MFSHAGCEIFPTQVVITGSSPHLYHICFYRYHRYIKGATAQIKHQDIPPACVVMAKFLLYICQSGSCGLVDDAENLQKEYGWSI